MRTRTFILSFFVHAIVIGAAMVARTFATTELPDPPRSTTFTMMASPQAPEVPPPPVRPPAVTTAPVNPDAAPLTEPESLVPEPSDLADTAPIGGSVILGAAGDGIGPLIVAPPPPPQPARVPAPRTPIRVGSGITPPQKIHHVAPKYPDIAQRARIDGTVIVEAVIAEDGSVRDVKILRSVPLLDEAAMDAVREWRFTPTLLNGMPVQVIMTVTVSFALN